VPDILGMIAPRTTALIINEAYLIVDNDVSQKHQIDTAIKLAASFSSGPFELAEKIGLQKIFNLLEHLTAEDKRYSPAPFLQKEISDLGLTT
jgi:3-hydroxybutyryl-CoA dehydrogenase